MKKAILLVPAVAGALLVAVGIRLAPDAALIAQQPAPIQNNDVPMIPFESVPNFLKYSADMNLGEVLGVAVNSKGHIVVLNHPGTATSGPLYGNATTQLFEFDASGQVRCARSARASTVSATRTPCATTGTTTCGWSTRARNSVMKFNPAGYVTMNLGRRPEGLTIRRSSTIAAMAAARGEPASGGDPCDGHFRAPTDIAWDSDDNIYISDGYVQLARRQVRQERQLDQVVGHARHRRRAREREPRPVQHAAQHRRRPPEQRLRRRSRQPPHPGVRSRRQVPAVHLPERAVRQEASAGARQPAREPARRDAAVDALHHATGRRSISIRRTRSRAGSTR